MDNILSCTIHIGDQLSICDTFTSLIDMAIAERPLGTSLGTNLLHYGRISWVQMWNLI